MSAGGQETKETTSDSVMSAEDKSENSQPENHTFDIHPRRPSILLESDLPEYKTYSCIKSKPSVFGGNCIHFQLSLDDQNLFHSKVKKMTQIEPIPVAHGTEVHYRGEKEYLLLTNANHEAFSLREKTPTGTELLVISMYQIVSVDEPKTVRVVYKNQGSEGATCLVSRKPTQNPDGTWILDFSERYTIPSKRNAILVDEQTKEEVLVIRKVEENEIEIDAIATVPPLYVFGTALSFWLASI
ncbi:hypothetical protein TVAG_340320 [Trichomonas vaginalis G3]|uniref:Uncharacterized protein n=1 Tax=Trichomonas vaginalis (strain ATCC PRA-98 / G3) TaxID=412133 RepID=A2EKE6_TRIV3|nr:tubby protein, chain A domain-containing protein [Trichomonas vaginalis G3]EAY06854.1 hypothetical protein TVAG_340320 [Trichomonas vaginalis G3]KAI5489206.1 tubby protein, chain A domain-containing protein [Trichomonas vaginalis G3]|eukprot:XP_001319077.1 hypothetical protein [Trichomonas vaginalis G3]